MLGSGPMLGKTQLACLLLRLASALLALTTAHRPRCLPAPMAACQPACLPARLPACLPAKVAAGLD